MLRIRRDAAGDERSRERRAIVLRLRSFFRLVVLLSERYTATIPTVQKWFPDRRGLASAIAIAGFGSGAAVWAPLSGGPLARFRSAPERVGDDAAALGDALATVDGARVYAGTGGEAVVATATDLVACGRGGGAGDAALEAGVFLANTGSTG